MAGVEENELLRFLDTLFSSRKSLEERKRVLVEEYGMALDEEMEGTVKEMCNLSDKIERDSHIQGYVESQRDDGKSDQEIIARIMSKFGLEKKEAEGYVLVPA